MSRTSSVAPQGPPQALDQYRTLPTALKRPLLRFTATQPVPAELTTPQSLLELSSTSYTARLAARNVLLEDPPPVGAALEEKQRRDAALKRGSKRPVDVRSVEKEKERAKRRRKVGVFAREEGRKRGVWDVGKNTTIPYNLLLPLHYMYLSYLSETLPLPPYPPHLPDIKRTTALPNGKLENGLGCEQISSRIIKADFTGACVRVKSSKNPSLIGLEGIVVQETAETVRVVTCANIVKVIPKSHALFTITIPAYAFPTLPHAPSSLHTPTPTFNADAFARTLREVPKIEVDILGSAFRFRAEDRAGRKFKVGSGATGWGQEWVGLEALGLDLSDT